MKKKISLSLKSTGSKSRIDGCDYMEAGATCNSWDHLKNPGAITIYFEHNTRLQYT